MRAASQGRLDYSKINHKDRLSIARETLILDELEREAWAEWEDIGRNMTMSMLSAQMSEEASGSIRSYLDRQLNLAGKRLIPWAKWAVTPAEKRQARVERAEAAKKQYEEAFGAITSVKVQEAERRAKIYLLSVQFAKRARRENRRFTQQQAAWIADARASQQEGGRVAWQRLSRMTVKEIEDLFGKTFSSVDVKSDIRLELGETA